MKKLFTIASFLWACTFQQLVKVNLSYSQRMEKLTQFNNLEDLKGIPNQEINITGKVETKPIN